MLWTPEAKTEKRVNLRWGSPIVGSVVASVGTLTFPLVLVVERYTRNVESVVLLEYEGSNPSKNIRNAMNTASGLRRLYCRKWCSRVASTVDRSDIGMAASVCKTDPLSRRSGFDSLVHHYVK